MHKLLTIGANTLQGFTNPVCNFLIIVFGIKTFGKENWGSFITVMIWVLFTTFILSWGNRDYYAPPDHETGLRQDANEYTLFRGSGLYGHRYPAALRLSLRSLLDRAVSLLQRRHALSAQPAHNLHGNRPPGGAHVQVSVAKH